MWHKRVMAFDTETTGFGSSDRVVELSLVFYEDGKEVEVWDTVVNPEGVDHESASVQQAMGINKLSWDQLNKAPTFEELLPEIEEQLARFPVWVAHNASFDERMLRQEFKRLAKEMPKPSAILCTMSIDRVLNKYAKGGKLPDVCGRWGVTLSDAHEATSDARACGEVLQRMVQAGVLPENLDQITSKQLVVQKKTEAYFNSRK